MKNYILILLSILFLATGCAVEEHTETKEIDALYWHERNRYSYAVDNGITIEIMPVCGGIDCIANIYTDVYNNERNWYKCKWLRDDFNGANSCTVNIHIKNLDDVRTSGWNHGKIGSGTTTRIN